MPRVWEMTLAGCCLLWPGSLLFAEVGTDGSLGQAVTLEGPEFRVEARLGRMEGGNLFHSFAEFSLSSGESAVFLGPNAVQRILGRVTGGEISRIDGLLRSEIPNADVYLLNPAGLVFGPNARLAIPGAFHASTADSLEFPEGGNFPARPDSPTSFSSAPPEAFGFLTEQPADIRVEGADWETSGGALHFSAGNLSFTDARLGTDGGGLVLSAGGAGQRPIDPAAWPDSAPERGEIQMTRSQLATSGRSGGAISLRTRGLYLQASRLQTDSREADGGGLLARAGEIRLEDGSEFTSRTLGTGQSGDIELRVDGSLSLSGLDEDGYGSRIVVNTESEQPGAGAGGQLRLQAEALRLADGGQLQTISWGRGQGGDMRITIRGPVHLRGMDPRGNASGLYVTGNGASDIQAADYPAGDGGTLSLRAAGLLLQDGAVINATSYGSGRGGAIELEIDGVLELSGSAGSRGSGISANASSYREQAGDGGNVSLRADSLLLRDGAQISTGTGGPGRGGDLLLEIHGEVGIRGQGSGLYTATESAADNAGDAGHLSLRAAGLVLLDGGTLRADSLGGGRGGDLELIIDGDVQLSGQDPESGASSRINSNSYGESEQAGRGGNIQLSVVNLALADGAQIGSNSFGPGPGGEVEIRAENRVWLRGSDTSGYYSSGLYTSAASMAGNGGDGGALRLFAETLRLEDGATLNATTYGGGQGGTMHLEIREAVEITGRGGIGSNAQGIFAGDGDGGNISLQTRQLLLSDGGQITVGSTGPGAGGNIEIDVTDDLTLSGIGPEGLASAIYSSSDALGAEAGPAGNILIRTGRLEIRDNARISAATIGPARGGGVEIQAERIYLSQGGGITAGSQGQGEAGTINIRVGQRQVMQDGVLETQTAGADGGNISLSSPGYLYLMGSAITTSVHDEAGRSGDGGDIRLGPEFILLDGSQIIARAVAGSGGNIDIQTTGIYQFAPSQIDAISVFGEDGVVRIESPEINVTEALEVQAGGFLDKMRLQQEVCARGQEMLTEQPSSLRTRPYIGGPLNVEDWCPSGEPAPDAERAAE